MKYGLLIFLLLANFWAWTEIWALNSCAKEPVKFYFLDVGQGDSQLIDFCRVQILIDGGPDATVLRNLEKILAVSDRYLDLVILTHPQLDHFGGLIDVLKRYQVGKFLDNGRQGTARAYKNLPKADLALAEGDKIIYGDYELKILWPPHPASPSSGAPRGKPNPNEIGLVALLDGPEMDVLYTADIGFETEETIRKKYKLRADILKVSHHGSKNSSGARFVNEVQPAVAVIGVGKNSYGHPNPLALERLQAVAAQIYTTLDHGIIKIIPAGPVSAGRKLRIFTEK